MLREWDSQQGAAVEGNTCTDLVTVLHYVCSHVVYVMYVSETDNTTHDAAMRDWGGGGGEISYWFLTSTA